MSELIVRPGADGATHVDMEYVGFEILQLDGTATRETGERELCVVLVQGECRVNDWQLAGRDRPVVRPARRRVPPARHERHAGGQGRGRAVLGAGERRRGRARAPGAATSSTAARATTPARSARS